MVYQSSSRTASGRVGLGQNRGLYLWFSWLRVVGVRVGSLMEVRRVKNRGIGGRKE